MVYKYQSQADDLLRMKFMRLKEKYDVLPGEVIVLEENGQIVNYVFNGEE